jgi:hypothetical protein
MSTMIGCAFVMRWGSVLPSRWLRKLAADSVVLSDVVDGAARCGTGRCRRWIPGKPNVESGVASVKQWSARSTLGSVAGLSNVVAALLVCLQRCVLLQGWATNECRLNQTKIQPKIWGRRIARGASRRPSVCVAIPALIASLGSITDT